MSRARLALSSRWSVPIAIGGVWFVAALSTLFWVWGLDTRVFPTPDEAVNRFAAALVGEHGHPFLQLPFTDPEDLAHPRSWISIGNVAVPTYAPVMFYVYGLVTRLGRVGPYVIAMLPAGGAAAFATGTALLLPKGRRLLALLAPALGFPALYWLLHPWMNVSALLIGLCWALFYWAAWRTSGSTLSLTAALLSVGAAAAIRPDYAAFLLAVALLFTVAASPAHWRRIALLSVLAGATALGANLILNHVLTGHAFRAAYQMSVDRQYGPPDSHGIPGLSALRVLLAPMGLPTLAGASREFVKYWLGMGPIAALLFGQLALIPVLWRAPRASRVSYLIGLLVVVGFMFTRLQDELYGSAASVGLVTHSVPRYLTPVYLFAALPPLVYLGSCRNRVLLSVGALLACALAADGSYELFVREPTSFTYLKGFVQSNEGELDALSREIPGNAMVYSAAKDKLLWSHWRLGTIEGLEPSTASMKRAVSVGIPIFVLEPRSRESRQLARALHERKLAFVRVDGRRGVYRVTREPHSN